MQIFVVRNMEDKNWHLWGFACKHLTLGEKGEQKGTESETSVLWYVGHVTFEQHYSPACICNVNMHSSWRFPIKRRHIQIKRRSKDSFVILCHVRWPLWSQNIKQDQILLILNDINICQNIKIWMNTDPRS